ncbi:4'-phosphopantetheinyl transferase [Methylophilaceae bacterium]|nr:4'-phosphopantetheinyl transferase [Methylophilaceae bacterium]
MNISQQDISLDHAGNRLHEAEATACINAAIAQFGHFSTQRKMRRAEQSISARELLMQVLAKHYPKLQQATHALIKTASGQPMLTGTQVPLVSIAHSHEWVACAIAAPSKTSNIGVDVEAIVSKNWDAYYRDVFHPAEKEWVSAAAGHEKDIRGFTCWCRKEAILKALGIGITVPLAEIGFSADGTLIALPAGLGSSDGWQTHSEVIENKAIAAIVWKVIS